MTQDPASTPATDEELPQFTRRDLLVALAPFWVPGLALVCAGLAYLAVRIIPQAPGRVSVWAPYLALGTLFPMVTALCIAPPSRSWPLPAVRTALASMPILAAAVVAGPAGLWTAAGLAGFQTCLYLALARRAARVGPVRAVGIFMTGFIAWSVLLQLFTWAPMDLALPPSWPVVVVGIVSLFACCWWAYGANAPETVAARESIYWLDAVAAIVLILLAFRTDGLFVTDRLGADGTFYHWGVMVGPAEAVRQGGWLLWDTPSPYGFLTTLAIAAFPTVTAWQSLYLLNAFASTALAIWLYTILRTNRRSPAGSAIALAVSVAVVFLVSTYPPTLTPEHYYPMSGAFRFGWCFVLIAVLLWERTSASRSREQTKALVLGCLCWLLSMLWSAESAVYGSVIWIPAFVLIVLREYGGFGRPRTIKKVTGWLILPPVLLAAALALIALLYQCALGHLPDTPIYVDSVVAFTTSRASEVSGLFGDTGFIITIAAPVLGFLLLALAAAFLASLQTARHDLPLVVALAFGAWALLSYPVGQPFAFAAYRLMPFIVLGLAIVMALVLPRHREQIDQLSIDVVQGQHRAAYDSPGYGLRQRNRTRLLRSCYPHRGLPHGGRHRWLAARRAGP
ncbi:MAG: hypothetical protein R2853_11935 [Thermomicrobiales bacterium]